MGGLEIACFTVKSAREAILGGADRIELCADRAVGGVTPQRETLEAIRAAFAPGLRSIPVFVMVRPRGGDFVYSEPEFEAMKRDIRSLMEAGAGGFVFGILTPHGDVDGPRNAELVQVASGYPCTFHRAFDAVPDFDAAMEVVIECGFKSILTAGCTDVRGAAAGVQTIKRLVQRADQRISIIPGGGVRSENVALLGETARADWFHSSAIVNGEEEASESEVRKLSQRVRQQLAAQAIVAPTLKY